jgi:hypothetical protein
MSLSGQTPQEVLQILHVGDEDKRVEFLAGELGAGPMQTVKGEDNVPFMSAARRKRSKSDAIWGQNASGRWRCPNRRATPLYIFFQEKLHIWQGCCTLNLDIKALKHKDDMQ